MALIEVLHFSLYEKERVNQVRLYIEKHYASSIKFSSLALKIGVLHKKLQAGIVLETGFRLKEYQLHLRIEKAKEMLSGDSLAIAAVARKTGFKKSSRFGAAFKSKTSLTPQEYRSSFRDKVFPLGAA